MIKSNFAIVTASVTVNEVCFLGLPIIAIKTARNQKDMYKYLKQNGYLSIKKYNKKKLHEYLKLIGEKY